MTRVRSKLGDWLRRLAELIDRPGTPKATHLSFTFEDGIGMVVHSGPITSGPNRLGCQLWYLNDDDYRHAFADSGKRTTVHVSTPVRDHPAERDRLVGLTALRMTGVNAADLKPLRWRP
jgi:hypothetical protein